MTRDAHSELFDLPTVTLYNFTSGYDPETGEASGWTEDSGTEVVAEPALPTNPQMRVGPSGQIREIEMSFRIRDDTGATLTSVGTDDARPTEVAYNGARWVVADVSPEGNGLVALLTVEV